MSYYEILGLPRDASTEEIEQAYRALARKVHPDLNAADATRAEARMKELNEIRATLTDPLLRSAYDARLRREEDEQAAAARRTAEAGPAGEYVRVVPETGGGAFVAPAGEARRRQGADLRRALLLALLVATVGLGGVLWGRSHREVEPPMPPAPAPVATLPPPPKPRPAPPAPHTTRVAGAHGRGVVKIGSSAADVLRVMGPPERTEPGSRPGNVVFVYGQLRLELRNGEVVGGGVK